MVLPIFMLILLGFGEAAFLAATQQRYQNGVDVLAQWAAIEMATSPGESWQAGWGQVVNDEQARADCDGEPDVVFLDGTHGPGDRILVQWRCHYTPRLTRLWEGLSVPVESGAVVPYVSTPPASPSPS